MKTHSVLFLAKPDQAEPYYFICMLSHEDAQRVAYNLMDEGFVFKAWIEEE